MSRNFFRIAGLKRFRRPSSGAPSWLNRKRTRLRRASELEPRLLLAGDAAAAFAPALANDEVTLPIVIRAAGETGEETMSLEIDGVQVQTWTNVGGDYANRVFETFIYEAVGPVSADSVRVVFSNDVYEPGVIDRNLRVDSISIDGRVFESEDASVFSTGTWKAADGIVPGYRTSEYLHSDGYFQYAETLPPSGSQINIFAAGAENVETMELWIAGAKVQTWHHIGGDADAGSYQTFAYTASTAITADQVQVHFTNDEYAPDGDPPVDRNLRVDRIMIDGVTFQTEAASVYSTGTYRDGIGIVPGYTQSEFLHSDGYFQFAAALPRPGEISLAASTVTVNEDAATATVTVVRNNGSDGRVTVDYRTISQSASDGADYVGQSGTLVFDDGETTQTIVIDLLDDALAEGDETFSVTIDNVVGEATLLAPRTATVVVRDNDHAAPSLPNYVDFASTSGLHFNGDATGTAGELSLTTSGNDSTGSVYYESPLSFATGESFTTAFSFRINGGNGVSGADGLTFVLQNSPAGLNAMGTGGGGLGYGSVGNSVAIEFDTYQNPGDINGNHVAVLVNGDVTEAVRTTPVAFDLISDNARYAWITYHGDTQRLNVFVSDSNQRPETPHLSLEVDLPSLLGGSGYVGFTAATGGLTNDHHLLSWQLDRTVPEDPVEAPPEIVAVDVISGLQYPTAIAWTPDARNLYVAEQGGVVAVARDGVKLPTPFIDISAQVNGTRDRGLLDIAVHPDFENNPYVYLLFTYDPPEVYENADHPLAGPDQRGNRAGRLVRVTADAATGYTTAIAGSEVVLLGNNSTWENFNAFANSTIDFNEPPAGELPDGSYLQDFIASDSESHTVASLAFGLDGALFVAIGDGASYNQVDPRAVRVLDIDSLSGKVLRIDPITGAGLPDNPFFNGDADANRSKVYQYGLRNPFRISVDPTSGQLFVGDVGWGTWEEINSAGPGANFGWPYYEGGSGTNGAQTSYQGLASFQEFLARGETVTPSLVALNHAQTGINAIVLGDVLTSDAYGAAYQGDLFFNDLGQGIVRNLSFNPDGTVASVDVFTNNASVVVDIAQGPDGWLYYVDLGDGHVGRWEIV